MYYENNLNNNVQPSRCSLLPTFLPHRNATCKKKKVSYLETEKWLIIDILNKKMEKFRKECKELQRK